MQKPSPKKADGAKSPPNHTVEIGTPNPSEIAAREVLSAGESETSVVEPLLAEVQSFLAKRSELARRVREEIAATELRLEQLKKTAASLIPERAAIQAKERKPKKPKSTGASGSLTKVEASPGDSPGEGG